MDTIERGGSAIDVFGISKKVGEVIFLEIIGHVAGRQFRVFDNQNNQKSGGQISRIFGHVSGAPAQLTQ